MKSIESSGRKDSLTSGAQRLQVHILTKFLTKSFHYVPTRPRKGGGNDAQNITKGLCYLAATLRLVRTIWKAALTPGHYLELANGMLEVRSYYCRDLWSQSTASASMRRTLPEYRSVFRSQSTSRRVDLRNPSLPCLLACVCFL